MSPLIAQRQDFLLASPYGGAFDGALNGFFDCSMFLSTRYERFADRQTTFELNRIFKEHMEDHLNRNDNPHLFHGIFISLLAEPRDQPYRPILLLKRFFQRQLLIEKNLRANREKLREARSKMRLGDDAVEVNFSPLFFVREYLTDPAYSASDAYAHALIRAEIFSQALRFAEIYPDSDEPTDVRQGAPFDRIRWYIRFDRIVASLQKIERFWLIRDNVAPVDATDFIVMHLLASRGYLVLRFGKKKLRDGLWRISRRDCFSRKSLIPTPGTTYEFRVLPEVRRLPGASEIANEIDGLPIPVPGSDTVLFRGLRFAENSGVVARIAGRTGTGKTSVALGIAVALAPLGTRTVYLSCEEQPADLEHRIQTLVPQNVRRLDVFNRIDDDWFSAEHVSGDTNQKYKKVQEFLEYIKTKYGTNGSRLKTPPGAARLLIVIDGVHELLRNTEGGSQQLFADQARILIEECRNTGAFVLILSAKMEQSQPDELDYLVDFVAGVDFSSEEAWEEPTRIINIYKTRRQSSRVGAHVLHISGRQGLRIAPHVSAQLEQRRDFKWVRPRTDYIFDFMVRPHVAGEVKPNRITPSIEIFDRSQILITGVGSAGKSAFALKLLTASLLPRHEVNETISRLQTSRKAGPRHLQRTLFDTSAVLSDPETIGTNGQEASIQEEIDLGASWFESIMPNHRKLLILSFLYQEDFYRETWKRIGPYRKNDAFQKKTIPRVRFDVHSFSPGYLRPEDFLVIVGALLDRQELEGWPYDGILIDGLHNVYLQFPYLEKSEMVWPMLFEMLRTRGLTAVTTHTYFTIDPGLEAHRLDTDDTESARRRAAPLLHALVQATDFRIRVSPESWETAKRLEARFPGEPFDTRIDVLGAIGQPVANYPLYWNRELGLVTDIPDREKSHLLGSSPNFRESSKYRGVVT